MESTSRDEIDRLGRPEGHRPRGEDMSVTGWWIFQGRFHMKSGTLMRMGPESEIQEWLQRSPAYLILLQTYLVAQRLPGYPMTVLIV